MEQYKPSFLGKCLPADDPVKMDDFINNKFDSFNAVYDACKSHAEDIKDVSVMETKGGDETSLSVKVNASENTMQSIASEDNNVTVDNNVVTANEKP